MLPNWFYYFIGKKSGDSPTPPEPPAPTKVEVPDGLQMFSSTKLQYTTAEKFYNFIDGLDFSNVTRWTYYFYSMNGGGLDLVVRLDTTTLKNSISNISYFINNCNAIKEVYLWNSFDTSNVSDFRYTFAYSNNLVEIHGIENFDFTSVTNSYLQGFIANDTKLSNTTLLNIAQALLTVPTNYGNKALSHLGLNSTQANYIVNNSTDWATLSANGWITGY